MDNKQDDGSLAFLNIAPDEDKKDFNCPETTQQQNTTQRAKAIPITR